MATSKEMTAGPALPLILKFTLPLLLGNLLQQTYSLVDAAIVGKFLGINALASVGASTSVVFLILGFCNGCCGGFGIPVAQKFGARDYSTMRSYVAVSLKPERRLTVSQRTDNARKKIVEKRTRHTDESDKQVSISSFKNILRCTHDPKNILT